MYKFSYLLTYYYKAGAFVICVLNDYLLTYILTPLSVYREAVCCQWLWCYWPAMITWFSTWAPPCSACSSAVSHRRRYHWPRATLTSLVRHYVLDTWCKLRHRSPPVPSLFKWRDVYGHRRWILETSASAQLLHPFNPFPSLLPLLSSPLFPPFPATTKKPGAALKLGRQTTCIWVWKLVLKPERFDGENCKTETYCYSAYCIAPT